MRQNYARNLIQSSVQTLKYSHSNEEIENETQLIKIILEIMC